MESVKKFERENRYIVIKRSDLKKVPVNYRSTMITPMFNLLPHLPRRECVVVESDWPEYEIVWAMIEHRMGGKPVPDFERVTAEREALQLMLNNRDDLDDQLTSLEQRRYAEQQAREAAERRVEELEGLLRRVVEPSVLSFEMDAPEKLESLEVDICAALADPVPPAGGDVEVLGYSVKGNRYAIRLTKAELLELYEGYTGDALVELVDRAHVTRLQAEVERLKQAGDVMAGAVAALDKRNAEVLALQAELTKARELWATEQAIKEQPGEDVLWQVLDAAVGVLTRRAAPHAWESEAFEAGRKIIMARREGLIATAPNQSAPADKGGDS